MTERPIKMESVIKRQLYQQDQRYNDRFLESMYETSCNNILASTNMAKMYTRDLFEACMSKDAANQGYTYCLNIISLIDEMGNEQFSDELQQTFIQEIVPYLENTELANLYLASHSYGCPERFCRRLRESATEYKIADRILANHERLCKRFDIIKYVDEHRHADVNKLTTAICEMVDTYSIPDYGKFNSIIEEMRFLWTRFNRPESFSEVVETATNYFIFSRVNEEGYGDTLKKLDKVLTENSCITPGDISPVYYLTESEDYADSNDVQKLIEKFNKGEKKTEHGFKAVMNKLYSKSPAQIIDESSNILSWIRPIVIFGVFVVNVPAGCVVALVDKVIQLEISRKQSEKMLKIFNSEKEKIEKKISSTDNDKTKDRLEKYLSSLEKCIEKLEEHRDAQYSDKELEKRREEKNKSDDDDFDFGNDDDFDFDVDLESVQYLKMDQAPERMRQFSNNVRNAAKILEAHIKLPSTGCKDICQDDAYCYLNEKDQLEACIDEFYIEEGTDLNKLHIALERASDAIPGSYYVLMDNTASLYLVDKKTAFVDADEELKQHTLSDADFNRLALFSEAVTQIEGLYNIIEHTDEFVESATNATTKLEGERLYIFIELMSMIDTLGADNIHKILDEFKAFNIESMDANKASVQNGVLEYAYTNGVTNKIEDPSDQIIMFEMAQQLLTEKFDLNGVKLAMANLKKKAKTLSSKEQQFSRNLDVAVNSFATSTKNALVSNRREAIIKGSVIPSFSRCIKIGIAAAGIGAIFGPMTTLIAALGAFAISKHLTKRERQIILDEIDTELKVVDKELDQLDHNPKKMRALLTYKKKLQRERQRIAYNLKVSGQPVPDAAVGGKDYDPD